MLKKHYYNTNIAKETPAVLYGESALLRELKNDVRKNEIKKFFSEDSAARLFYSAPRRNDLKHQRNATASTPLQIIHLGYIHVCFLQ